MDVVELRLCPSLAACLPTTFIPDISPIHTRMWSAVGAFPSACAMRGQFACK